MVREEIKNKIKEYGFEIPKLNQAVYDYVYNKTKSKERALIPAHRYKNIYHIKKYEFNSLKNIMSTNFLKRLPDIDKASELIQKHIDNNSLIYQVADYDVDKKGIDLYTYCPLYE